MIYKIVCVLPNSPDCRRLCPNQIPPAIIIYVEAQLKVLKGTNIQKLVLLAEINSSTDLRPSQSCNLLKTSIDRGMEGNFEDESVCEGAIYTLY